MIKQKIVIKVQMNGDRCRTKAMKIAAVAQGVISVALGGGDRDQVVVTGTGVDSVKLASRLRKKVGHASIVTVEEVKEEKKETEKEKDKKEIVVIDHQNWGYNSHYSQYPIYERVVYNPEGPGCSIM